MRIFITLLVAMAIIGIAAIGFAYSGIYDVGASSPHSGVVRWFLSTTSHASVERRARDVVVPDLSDESLALAGVNDFDAMCIGCHGAPGRTPAAMGQGLNPPAPDLAEAAARMTPAELFWVTKHGIKMTGMPAWGATHDDESIWPVVAFMTRLPTIDADGYRDLLASAVGMGHHASGDDHGDHDHGEGASSGDGHEHGADAAHDHSDAAEHDHSAHPHDDEQSSPESDHHDDGHDHEHDHEQ